MPQIPTLFDFLHSISKMLPKSLKYAIFIDVVSDITIERCSSDVMVPEDIKKRSAEECRSKITAYDVGDSYYKKYDLKV